MKQVLGGSKAPLQSGQNMPFSYWSMMFSIPVLQLIVLETGNVLMGHGPPQLKKNPVRT